MNTNAKPAPNQESTSEVTCRVLIVEDDSDSSKFLALALQKSGHEVQVTRNGTEALTVAVGYKPHVVLIDIGLPGLDGIYVAKQLRISHPHVLIVAVTGRSSPEDVRRSHDAGCDHHLVKPIDLKSIAGILDRWKGQRGCHD